MKYVRWMLVFLVVMSGAGCAAWIEEEGFSEEGKALNMQSVADDNKKSLEKLGYGISKKAVLQIMGETDYELKDKFLVPQPYQQETYRIDGRKIEVLYYVTDVKEPDRDITRDELTPVIIEDGQYTGWGDHHLRVVGVGEAQ